MISAALGVADDDEVTAEIPKHLRRDLAGVGAGLVGRHILAAPLGGRAVELFLRFGYVDKGAQTATSAASPHRCRT